ncbi:MAG: heavy-metal-associated domain-containing protein [Nitrospirae bacterium]|nr:heavy-metal-associated domain-containing protein [Nitrospirota bacterium]
MTTTVLKIEGMSCQHCVMRVKKALDGTDGIVESTVGIGSASVSYDEAKIRKEDIVSAIEKAGYKVAL